MKKNITIGLVLILLCTNVFAQQKSRGDSFRAAAYKTEWYRDPLPVVTPGSASSDAPSDAILLFGGSNLNEWVLTKDTTKQADWKVADGILTVNKPSGNIQTKKAFTDYQLHIEWRIPVDFAQYPGNAPDFYKTRVPGDSDLANRGQLRGNSGVFLASTGKGDNGYELQILDNYKNATYINGQAGAMYKQSPPLVTANKKPGEWQTYDVIWTAPKFNADSSLKSPAHVTVLFNGVLVQNDYVLTGGTEYIGAPHYKAHGACPIKLQAHGDPSAPISFRNIWIRNL
jgi:hypothetical protein